MKIKGVIAVVAALLGASVATVLTLRFLYHRPDLCAVLIVVYEKGKAQFIMSRSQDAPFLAELHQGRLEALAGADADEHLTQG